ncbi:27 kDa glycoprotein-like isoform X1 [Pieris brassicae]|uniref:27 kDa glycoprotein-like isoform X1 n=1 Tax=Pieris brassicae TaxID=7116 RepID=UPI001E65E94A|nr:27 kDa glycoprotein-like isoform X1 [Pieris brassicae]XP_045524029.1 27 kDa glycoprotein-like isoform X1 [Pieris brassicae]
MFVNYFLILVILGLASCQSTERSIGDAINALPPELQGKVDQKQIEAIQNKSTELFKEKCEKNGGLQAYENAESAFKSFQGCISALVDPSKLQQEIEEAKPQGQVDEVFKKYCDKTPSFRVCFSNMTDAVKPCLAEDEQQSMKTVHNITEQLADFICFKEGDRIAQIVQKEMRKSIVVFIAENGPECIQEKQEDLQACFNSTIGSVNVGEGNFTANSIPSITFGQKECQQLTELQKCVVKALGGCPSPTSANIIDSLFKFALKATPCKDFIDRDAAKKRHGAKEEKKGNSAHRFAVSSFVLSAVVLKALF